MIKPVIPHSTLLCKAFIPKPKKTTVVSFATLSGITRLESHQHLELLLPAEQIPRLPRLQIQRILGSFQTTLQSAALPDLRLDLEQAFWIELLQLS